MIFLRRFVSKFGVTLCVAPILFLSSLSASAQQGNYQTDVLFDLQAMRQEIAELRDMVERQDYQIRQLQRNAPRADQNTANGGQPSYQDSAVNNELGTNTQPYINTDESPFLQSDEPNQSNTPLQNGLPPYAAADDQGYQSVPSADRTPSDSRVLAPEGLPSVETVDNYPSTVIDERVIGQQSNTPNYPPVEERTIGSSPDQIPVYDPETYNQAPVANQPLETNQPSLGAQQQSTVTNQQPANGSSPDFPAPYQRTIPSRQPVSNNIPTTGTQPGNVIAIPNTATPESQVPQKNSAPLESGVLDEQSIYQQGFDLLKQSKHDDAVTMFKQQITNYPTGEYSDDAHYWIAESLYVNRDLDQSKLYFRSIVDNFSQSPRVPDAMLKTAYIEQEQGNGIEARILLQEIIQYHPRSNAAISAKNRLADIQ